MHFITVLRENQWNYWTSYSFWLKLNQFFVIIYFCPFARKEKFLFFSNKIVLEPSSYRQTQLIILYTNQLRTKTLANLLSRALALMREPHIQLFTLSVYPDFSPAHLHVLVSGALQRYLTHCIHFLKMLHPF